MRTIGVSTHDCSPSGTNVRSGCTIAPLALKWWLPDPHRPIASQVSSIVTASGSSTAILIRGWPFSKPSIALAKKWVACSHPLANPHRPVSS